MTAGELIDNLKSYDENTIVCIPEGYFVYSEVESISIEQIAGNKIGRKTGIVDILVLQ